MTEAYPDNMNSTHRGGHQLSPNTPKSSTIDERANELYCRRQRQLCSRIDRMFAVLMVLQWLAAMAAACWLTPLTWNGAASSIHPHVWLAVLGGGAMTAATLLLVLFRSGTALARHVIAISQVAYSALFIHLSGGRIEAHFHVFGSLAFLAAYRDWRILISATVFVAVDHFLRGVFVPQSVYGVITVEPWRWLEHAAWVLFEDAFLILSIQRSAQDTKRVAAQTAKLEQQNNELELAFGKERAILQGALDAIIQIDKFGRVTAWNPQAEQVFGWSAAEVVGQNLADYIIPAEFREAHRRGLARLVETGRGSSLNRRLDLEAIDRQGRRFPVEIACTATHQGGDVGFCAFVRDISARKQHESDMQQAIEAANAANKAKSEFLANMSHEIRTPLNAILGFAELLNADGVSPAESRQFIDTIQSSGRHLLTLINDILDLSKIESGHLEVEFKPCSPNQIIEETMSILRVRAREKGLTLESRWASPVPVTIVTDPVRFRQALMNLVNNAIRFTERGSVTLVVSLAGTQDRPQLVVEVVDTGIGIAANDLERVFMPFVQVDSSTTRRVGGTGLGLAISRQIARRLGGDISVTSVVGRGSCFRLAIDTGSLEDVAMRETPHQIPLLPRHENSRPSVPQIRLDHTRILIVEDGEVNRLLLTFVLNKVGALTDWVENGKDALDRIAQKPFDVVLMDMQMPVMDGYTATRTLRERGCKIPIIALTAHAMRGDELKCLDAGCDSYLSKPIEATLLVQTIAELTTARNKNPIPTGLAISVPLAPMAAQS